MTDEWQDTPEEDGITLGPEEALEREIAKSKSLKVERLQLRDQVERLTVQNRSLCDQLEALKQKPKGSPGDLKHSPDTPNSQHSRNSTARQGLSAKPLGVLSVSVQSDSHRTPADLPVATASSIARVTPDPN